MELVDEVIHLIGGYTPLAIGYIQKGDYLEALLGRKGEGTPVGVNHPSQYLLDSFPVPILSQRFIYAGGVLHLTCKGREDLL